MSDFEEVERPARFHSGKTAALIATATTGKAIRLPGTTVRRISYIYAPLKFQGYRLHTRTDGPDVLAWCERIVPNGHGAEGDASK